MACISRFATAILSGETELALGTIRPGAQKSSEAAFCKSAFAKSKLTFGKSAFARSKFAFRQSIFASQKARATSKMLSAKTCQNVLESIFAFR